MQITSTQIENFLREVDRYFPVPLSRKQDLHDFSLKLHQKATLCYELSNGEIEAMVAGYTENLVGNVAYVSVVATRKSSQGKGLASKLIKEFIAVCKEKRSGAVHLYTDKSNVAAIKMYRKIGFSDWILQDEPRPDDIHLIYYV